MSTWTHVAAVFRIDGVRYIDGDEPYPIVNGRRHIKWDEVTGKTIYEPIDVINADTYEKRRMHDDWEAYHANPKAFVPTGSEGSLQRLVWANQDTHCAAAYTVTVFGDLRDYDDLDAIEAWFESVCDRCYIRQAVCHAECDGTSRTFKREWA